MLVKQSSSTKRLDQFGFDKNIYSCKALIDTALIDTFFTWAMNGVVQQNFEPKVKIIFFFITVVTPNKGQSIFVEVGSNKRISGIPLFVIFEKWSQIRDFEVEIRRTNCSFRILKVVFRSVHHNLPPSGWTRSSVM